jgi:hypothetical protein
MGFAFGSFDDFYTKVQMSVLCHAVNYDAKLARYRVNVRFEVFTAVTMKKGVFWDVTPCGSLRNQRVRGT